MIDPRAIIDPSAVIGENVSVGPWSIIGPDVEIGDGCQIASHVIIKGPTKMGANNRIFQFASVGEDTPDLKYKGEPTRLVMGDNNTIREGVTLHRGTIQDRAETTIGNNNLMMAYAHVGHDSVIGDNVILVNNVCLAGHVHVGDWAILAGASLVQQYIHIGSHGFLGAGAFLTSDMPDYVTATGNPAQPRAINRIGLKRRGFTTEQVNLINNAYKILYRRGLSVEEALSEIAALSDDSVLSVFIDSVRNSPNGIIR